MLFLLCSCHLCGNPSQAQTIKSWGECLRVASRHSLTSSCPYRKLRRGKKRGWPKPRAANPHLASSCLSAAKTLRKSPYKKHPHWHYTVFVLPIKQFLATKDAWNRHHQEAHFNSHLRPALTCREETEALEEPPDPGVPATFPITFFQRTGTVSPGLTELASTLTGQEGKACLYF